MIEKFALQLCPVHGCSKIGLSEGAVCPTHQETMTRTVVMTEAFVKTQAKERTSMSMTEFMESLGLGSKR